MMTQKIWDFLGSRNLSVYIFITGLTYTIFLVIFSTVVPIWWVSNISKLLPFKILYLFFFMNLIVCEIKWLPVILRRCKKATTPATVEDLERFRDRIEIEGPGLRIEVLAKYLRRRGYGVQTPGPTPETGSIEQRAIENGKDVKDENDAHGSRSDVMLYASRSRFSPIGNLIFHVSFLFILVGGLFSMISHFEKNVLLMEGQSSDDGFEVIDIKPEFWGNRLLFTGLQAGIKSYGEEHIVRLSSAANIGGGRRVTIQGIGYTPKYVLRKTSGEVADVGYVNLVNFIPGSVDHFRIPELPYKIYLSIYPDYEFREGKISTKSMNLLDPRFLVKVVRGKLLLYSGIISLKEEIFFDNFRLSFPEIKYNGTFRIIMDKGEPLIWTGLIFMAAGLIWRLLFFRREVAVSIFEGKIYLYLSSEYYPALFAKKCRNIIETGRQTS